MSTRTRRTMEEDGQPPIHLENDGQGTPPESILLDVRGYVDARTNATTAYACASASAGRGAIGVTFWVSRPPRVSCFTVHCDGVGPEGFRQFPMTIAAEDDMVLLGVTREVTGDQASPGRRCHVAYTEYLVYQAAGATSILRPLPDPGPLDFKAIGLYPHPHPDPLPLVSAGILRLRSDGDGFIVAALHVMAGPRGQCEPAFNLQLFDSRTWTWTSRWMHVDDRGSFCYFSPMKVLVIGGERGSMGWVDQSKGILTCDVLAVDDEGGAVLRHIPLPPWPETGPMVWPRDVFDIAMVQGRIKFFQMQFKFRRQAITSTTALLTKCWIATSWEKMDDPCQQWRKDWGIDIFNVPVETTSHSELPSHLRDMGKLHGSQPGLSLHEEDVVYIMAKAERDPELNFEIENGYGKDHRRRWMLAKDHTAWMLAVDMRKKTLRGVAAFDAGRTEERSMSYLQSMISNYMSSIESSKN